MKQATIFNVLSHSLNNGLSGHGSGGQIQTAKSIDKRSPGVELCAILPQAPEQNQPPCEQMRKEKSSKIDHPEEF